MQIWQSDKASPYQKKSKLHQFVYLINTHHQKKGKYNRRKFRNQHHIFLGG